MSILVNKSVQNRNVKLLIEQLEKLTGEQVILKEDLTPFLKKLKEKLIDYKNGGSLKWLFLRKLPSWPVIEYGQGGEDPKIAKEKNLPLEKEHADLENFEVINLTPKELIVSAGGDWQWPYVITIKLTNGKLTVTNSRPYIKGDRKGKISEKDIYTLLQAEDILPLREHTKAKEDARRLVNQSFDKDYWKEIREKWDSLDKGGYEGPQHDELIKPLIEAILNDKDLYFSSNKKLILEYMEQEIANKLNNLPKKKIDKLVEQLERLTERKIMLVENSSKYEVIFFDSGDNETIVSQKFDSYNEAKQWADGLEYDYQDIAIDEDGNDYWKTFYRYYNSEDKETYVGYTIRECKMELSEKTSKYKNVKKRIQRMQIPSLLKDKILKYVNSGTHISDKHPIILGLTMPFNLKDKIKDNDLPSGFSFGADKNGFFIYTHRARSESHKNPEDITFKEIKFIDSTG